MKLLVPRNNERMIKIKTKIKIKIKKAWDLGDEPSPLHTPGD